MNTKIFIGKSPKKCVFPKLDRLATIPTSYQPHSAQKFAPVISSMILRLSFCSTIFPTLGGYGGPNETISKGGGDPPGGVYP